MSPKDHFDSVWARCSHISILHTYLENNVADIVKTDELLRAEWASRVSALDLYVHELVAQNMRAIFEGLRSSSAGYQRYKLSNETLGRIRGALTAFDAASAFELDIREQLSFKTFQFPDDIAEGVRLISNIELWNEVAINLGAPQSKKQQVAKGIKKTLSAIIERRNKIVHEGDLQPIAPRQVWPINKGDLAIVELELKKIVDAIDAVI